MESTANVADLLGLQAPSASRDADVTTLIDVIDGGLPVSSLHCLLKAGQWQLDEVLPLLGVSEKTIRRYQKNRSRFTAAVSEKLVALAKLQAAGVEIFGDAERFNAWLRTPSRAFGDRRPMELLTNSEGARVVMEELRRLEWGVYS